MRAPPRISREAPIHNRAPKEGLRPGWYDLRFTPDPEKIEVVCAACRRSLWFSAGNSTRYKTCGGSCASSYREQRRAERRRECQTCGAVFYPKASVIRKGLGRFCSQKCNKTGAPALNGSAGAQARRASRLAEMRAAGEINYRRGPDYPGWKGGKAAHLARARKSGRSAEWLRTWRHRHPEKAREFARRRAGRKIGRLPRGTIKRIGEAQKWRCAICGCGIKNGYHVDHILPFALGGKHIPANIQLLCKSCNLHKSSKDPIEYMQSLGRLL